MILVDIYIPSLDNSYDFLLDDNTAVEQVIIEISEMISKKVKNKSINLDNISLYWIDKKYCLEREKTLFTCGVTDGCRLMLV